MTSWREVIGPAPTGPAGRGRVLARALVPFAIAAALALLGVLMPALVVALVGVALGGVALVRPAAAQRFEHVLAGVGRLVGRVLTTVLLGLVELLVLLPLAVLARVFGRDPLAQPGHRSSPGWVSRASSVDGLTRRPFGSEAAERRRRSPAFRASYATVRVIGWVVIVLALNYGLGWTWDEYFGTHDTPAASSAPRGTIEALASSPAMRSEPWADRYWDEFRALDYDFHPFILSRVAPTEGRYIDAQGAVRRSYVPVGLGDGAPEVWFLGGAALWGEGQRDLHTIPSEVARLAEDVGRPIRAVNLGQPGYTSWQAALLLEQELAVRPAPDLVVLYDGAADVAVQLEQASDAPTHYNVQGVTDALVGRDSAREQAEDWWQEYRDTSVVGRLLDRVRGVFGAQPAAADGLGLADRVADLHARSVDLASHVARRHGVDAIFAWQAAEGVPGDGGAYRRVAGDQDGGSAGVADLSGVLDDHDEPLYLDGVLTGERGARIVAASLWPLLRPALP